MSLVKVNIHPLVQDASGVPQVCTGTLTATVCKEGWPVTHLETNDPDIILPKPIVIDFVDSVLSQELYFTDIGTDGNYYHVNMIVDGTIVYQADVRLPNNHTSGEINWSHLTFKGAL
jgi:hypothetical protein